MQTTKELRQILSAEIEALRSGRSSSSRLRSIALACSTMLKSRQLDMQFSAEADRGRVITDSTPM